MVIFDQEAYIPSSMEQNCFSELSWAFPENIEALEKFVKKISTRVGESVYSKAFQKAFQYFHHVSSITDAAGSIYLTINFKICPIIY